MYDAEYWEAGRGFEELEAFRKVLRRYGWVIGISLEEGGGIETWYPPEDDLRWCGISLTAKYHGFWSTLGHDNHDIVGASPESLDRHLSAMRPHVA